MPSQFLPPYRRRPTLPRFHWKSSSVRSTTRTVVIGSSCSVRWWRSSSTCWSSVRGCSKGCVPTGRQQAPSLDGRAGGGCAVNPGFPGHPRALRSARTTASRQLPGRACRFRGRAHPVDRRDGHLPGLDAGDERPRTFRREPGGHVFARPRPRARWRSRCCAPPTIGRPTPARWKSGFSTITHRSRRIGRTVEWKRRHEPN